MSETPSSSGPTPHDPNSGDQSVPGDEHGRATQPSTEGFPHPGLYKDPVDGEGQRYWDGTQWTAHEVTRPAEGKLNADRTQLSTDAGTREYRAESEHVPFPYGGGYHHPGLATAQRAASEKASTRMLVFVSVAMIIMGVPFIVAGLAFFNGFHGATVGQNVPNAVRTQALVVSTEVVQASNADGAASPSKVCFVKYEFQAQGTQYAAQSATAAAQLCQLAPGTIITIAYDEANPATSDIADPNGGTVRVFSYLVLIFPALGAALILTGVYRLVRVVARRLVR